MSRKRWRRMMRFVVYRVSSQLGIKLITARATFFYISNLREWTCTLSIRWSNSSAFTSMTSISSSTWRKGDEMASLVTTSSTMAWRGRETSNEEAQIEGSGRSLGGDWSIWVSNSSGSSTRVRREIAGATFFFLVGHVEARVFFYLVGGDLTACSPWALGSSA